MHDVGPLSSEVSYAICHIFLASIILNKPKPDYDIQGIERSDTNTVSTLWSFALSLCHLLYCFLILTPSGVALLSYYCRLNGIGNLPSLRPAAEGLLDGA